MNFNAALCVTACAILAVSAYQNNAEKIHAKTYPGFTVFDKNGDYIKLIGPLYAKVKVKLDRYPPFSVHSQISFRIEIVPTIDSVSIFVNGTILYQGYPTYTFDPDEDVCLGARLSCPLPAGKRIVKTGRMRLKEQGLLPGTYKGSIDIFSHLPNSERLRFARGEFRVTLRDD